MLQALELGEKLEDLVLIVCIRERGARHTRRIGLRGAAFEASAQDPAERMRLVVVPVGDEAIDGAHRLIEVAEGCMLQHPTREDTEPDLHLAHPRRVQRRVQEAEAAAVSQVERLPRRPVMDALGALAEEVYSSSRRPARPRTGSLNECLCSSASDLGLAHDDASCGPQRRAESVERPDLAERQLAPAPLANGVLRARDRGVAGAPSRQQNDPRERAALARMQLQAGDTRTGHVLASNDPRSRKFKPLTNFWRAVFGGPP